MATKPTIDDVRKALFDLMLWPGQSLTAKKILRKFGSETITGLKKKKYQAVIDMAVKKTVKAEKKSKEK
jgi:hypothetical protein